MIRKGDQCKEAQVLEPPGGLSNGKSSHALSWLASLCKIKITDNGEPA